MTSGKPAALVRALRCVPPAGLRDLPQVQALLELPRGAALCALFRREHTVDAIRQELSLLRERVLDGTFGGWHRDWITRYRTRGAA